ncbi:hypothetical protein [Kribbella deserti]|uniref:Uncharacterized protein n=1 Tax=Kribbella deserti TaxID=1926257 RepID=A0ABV6QJW6_9ACTN
MTYDDFRREYDAVLRAGMSGGLDGLDLRDELARLTAFSGQLEPADRDRAVAELDELRAIVDRQDTGPMPPATEEALAIVTRAQAVQGSPADRIAAAEQAVAELNELAEVQADERDARAVLRLAEPLVLLAGSLALDGEQ